jgi:hypothetical protein
MPVTIDGTTGITTPALVNGTALSFRNKIINGNFGINQRVYVSGTATSGANQYTVDRWRVVTSGQNLTFSASGIGNIVTAPAGGIEQVIESLNIEGGTYTLSWTGTATGAVNGSAVSNGGQVTLTANTNATIKFSSGTVSQVQLEAGSVATPFENRPIGTELALCQRYYWRKSNTSPSDTYYFNLLVAQTTNSRGSITPPVTMRSIPTITQSNLSDFIIYDGTSITSVLTSISLGASPTDGNQLGISCSASSGGLTLGRCSILLSNISTAWMAFSSEL